MDSSPGLYRCASPNLAHFLRELIAGVTFFVCLCVRDRVVRLNWASEEVGGVGGRRGVRRGEGESSSAAGRAGTRGG